MGERNKMELPAAQISTRPTFRRGWRPRPVPADPGPAEVYREHVVYAWPIITSAKTSCSKALTVLDGWVARWRCLGPLFLSSRPATGILDRLGTLARLAEHYSPDLIVVQHRRNSSRLAQVYSIPRMHAREYEKQRCAKRSSRRRRRRRCFVCLGVGG